MSNEARRNDAREKIMLGGLIVKAGLRNANRAFLLGVLLEAASLDEKSSDYTRLQQIGEKDFQTEPRKANRKEQPEERL